MASKYETCKLIMEEYFASQGIKEYPKFDQWIQFKIEWSKRKSKPKIDIDKRKYLDFVYLTHEEYNKLAEEYWDMNTKKLIQALNNYIGSKWTNYKSHYYTLKAWAKKDNMRKPAPQKEVIQESINKLTEEEKLALKEKMLNFKKSLLLTNHIE